MDSNMPAEEALSSEASKGERSASQEGSFDLPELIPIGKINSGRNEEMPSLGDPELPVEKPKPAEPVQDAEIVAVEEVTEIAVQKAEDSSEAVVLQNSDKTITLEKLVQEATEESPTPMDTNNTDVLITLTETNSLENSVIESDKQNDLDNNTVPEDVVVDLTECIVEEGTVDQNDSGNTLEGESEVAPNDGISAEEPAKEASSIEEIPPQTPVEEMPAETPVGETSVKTPVEEVTVKASIGEPASKAASEEETNKTSIEEETNKTSVEEETNKTSIKEVSIEVPTEEVSIETPDEEIIIDETPTEVAVEETPIEVSVEETPMQVSVDETPIEMSVNETSTDITVNETPANVTVDETPVEVSVDEMLVEEQPQPVTTDIEEEHVLVENDVAFPTEQLEDKASENAYVVEADTSNEMDDVEYHVVINDTETVSVNGMPQLTKQDIGVYETEVAIKTDEECSFEKQVVHDVTISGSEVQNPETSAIISLASDTITEVTLSDVQVLEDTQEGLVTLSELNEQTQQEVVILQDESMLLMEAEEYDQPESIEVTSQEERELEEGESKLKIPCHVLGRNIENPLEDPVRNGRLLMKPRLGVKIPYRNLTSQIVSKQDIANEIMERSRIRQASAEPPAGGDVFFAKKLTQRLARKLTSPEKTLPKSATKTSSSSSASSSKRVITSSSKPVPSSKSSQAPPKQQTVTVATSKVHVSAVITPKSNSSSSKPPVLVKASDKITDNSDLIALLEGDDDTDWTTVCPKKNDLSNSNKTDSSKKSDKSVSKRPSDWERETALKQLRELPMKSSKDYIKSSSSSKTSELLPPKQIIKEFKEPIKAEQAVESSPPKDPLDELKDDLNSEPRFSSSLVMKTYTRKRKPSEDIMKPILASATIIHPPKKMMILGEPKTSSTVQKQSSSTSLQKQVAASQKQIPTPQKQGTPQKPAATSQKSSTISQKSTTTSQKSAATPQKPAATPQKPAATLQKPTVNPQKQAPPPQKSTSQKQSATPAPKHPSSTSQKSSSQKPPSTPSTPKPTATPSGQKSVQKSSSSSNISKQASTVSKAASTPNIPKALSNSTQKATPTPVQKTPVVEKKVAVSANEKKRPSTPTKPVEPVVEKKTLSPNTYISKSSRIVKRKKIWDPDEANPVFKVSPALKSPKPQEVSPEKTVEKKSGKAAVKPNTEKATPKSNEKLDGSTPKTAEKKIIKSVGVLKPSNEKSKKKGIVKKVLKKKMIRPKRLTEVDRLLMDEGAVNLLYSVKNTEELQNLRKKKKKTVISLDRAQRELLNKTNEIKNDLQINSTKDSPISLRKKEGGTPKASPVKIELAATILQRKKSKDSITGSVHSPPASPAYAYSQHAEASRIIRRHSSSSFSSEDTTDEEEEEEEDETDTEKSTKQKTAAAESPKKKQKIAHEKQGKAAPAGADKQQVKEEISKTSKASPDDPKYSQFETFNVRKFDNLVQLILAPTLSNGQTTLTLQVLTELITILDLLQKDNTCRVVLFSSSGNSFCQGIDYKDLACDDQKKCQSIAEKYASCIREFLTALTKFSKILVAGVHGNTVGIGVTMLPLFDMVLASDTATFSTPYAQLGCAAEGGVLLTLPHVMHNALASELFFASRKLTAAEALRLGLVTRTLWPDKFQEELIAALKIISGQSLQSMQAIKKQLRQHLLQNVESSLKSESATLIRHWVSSECQSNFSSYSVESK